MNISFYKNEELDIVPIKSEYQSIKSPYMMYDILNEIWSIDTCAPRLRYKYSEKRKSIGQCSITSFLVQDVFGGEVYGIKLDDGNYHCFNVIGGKKFDLTSEQFDETLDYENCEIQKREVHFQKLEKFERYKLLKDRLNEYIKNKLVSQE